VSNGRDRGWEGHAFKLPEHVHVVEQAQRELLRFKDRGAAPTLIEAFVRRSHEGQFLREDEPLPIGKGQTLRAIRKSYQGSEYRLIYMQVRGVVSRRSERVVVAVVKRPIRFVGLLAWQKKQPRVGGRGKTAWARSQEWLRAHPDYERV